MMLSKTLPADSKEAKIITLKYSGKQIGAMTEAEVNAWGKVLLLKVHVITGWVIPESELLIILIDQFKKKMVESYPNTNPDEIEYAFRNFGTTVKDWGKAMNLSLIDEVMIPYLNERKRLSHEYEERKAPPPPMILNTPEELDNFHRMWTEQFFQRIRRGHVEAVPEYTKEILVKDGLVKNGESIYNFFVQKLNNGAENIYIKDGE